MLLGLAAGSVAAQELTPRLYAPAPTGGNIVVLSYGRSTGALLFDPSLPFDDVNAAISNRADVQSNSRLGVTLGVPLGRRSSLKVAWATGFTTRVGADFDTFGVALQTVWFRKP